MSILNGDQVNSIWRKFGSLGKCPGGVFGFNTFMIHHELLRVLRFEKCSKLRFYYVFGEIYFTISWMVGTIRVPKKYFAAALDNGKNGNYFREYVPVTPEQVQSFLEDFAKFFNLAITETEIGMSFGYPETSSSPRPTTIMQPALAAYTDDTLVLNQIDGQIETYKALLGKCPKDNADLKSRIEKKIADCNTKREEVLVKRDIQAVENRKICDNIEAELAKMEAEEAVRTAPRPYLETVLAAPVPVTDVETPVVTN
jgi:hypothetical protein